MDQSHKQPEAKEATGATPPLSAERVAKPPKATTSECTKKASRKSITGIRQKNDNISPHLDQSHEPPEAIAVAGTTPPLSAERAAKPPKASTSDCSKKDSKKPITGIRQKMDSTKVASKPQSSSALILSARAKNASSTIQTPKTRKMALQKTDAPPQSTRSTITAVEGSRSTLTSKRSKTELELNAKTQPKRSTTSHTALDRGVPLSTRSNTIHIPGTIPSYMNKPDKFALTSRMSEKLKKLSLVRKQLVDNLEVYKQYFDELTELNTKVLKVGGKTVKLENIELIKHMSNEDGPLLVSSELGRSPTEKSLHNNVIGSELISNNTLKLIEQQLDLSHQQYINWYTKTLSHFASLSEQISQIKSLEDLPKLTSALMNSFEEHKRNMEQMHTEEPNKHRDFIFRLKSSKNEDEEIARKNAQIAGLLSQLAAQEAGFTTSQREELASKDDEINRLHDQLDDLKHKFDLQESVKISLMDSEISTLKAQLADQKGTGIARPELLAESGVKDEQIRELKLQLSSLQAKLDDNETKRRDSLFSLDVTKSLIRSESSSDEEEALSMELAAELKQKNREIETLQKDIDLHKQAMHDKKLLEETSRCTQKQLHEEYSDLRKKYQARELENTAKETELRNLIAEREKLIAKLTSSNDSSNKTCQQLRTRIAQFELDRESQPTVSMLNDLRQKLHTRNQEFEQLLVDMDVQRNEMKIVQRMSDEAHQRSISQLSENYSALKDEYAKHKLESYQLVEQVKLEKSEKEKALAELTEESKELTKSLSNAVAKNQQLVARISKLQDERTHLDADLSKNFSDALTKNKQLVAQLAKLESDRVQFLTELSAKQNELDAIKAEQSKSKADTQINNHQLIAQATKLETDRVQLYSNINAKQEQLEALKNDLRSDVPENKEQIEELEKENQRIQDELNTLSTIREQLKVQLEAEMTRCKTLEIANAKQHKHLKHKSTVVQKLEMALDLDSNKLVQSQAEFERLKQQQQEEMAVLQSQLDESRQQCSQHEETIAMHQRILRIRSQLINAMRKKGESNRCRMVDLYAEIGKKSSIVNKMDFEISARAEEMQNLFSTLSTKQLEVSRQDQLIKMLEECNAHNLRIRAKQFERMTKLEKENGELKKRILLGGPELNIEGVMTPRSTDTAFNRNMFREERRKKRRELCSITKPKSCIRLNVESDALANT